MKHAASIIWACLACWSSASAATLESETTYPAASVRGAFLTLAPGARPAGMGGTFTGTADDASGAAWNPAGLGRVRSPSVLAMHQVGVFGTGISHLAGAVPIGPGVGGASLSLLTASAVEGRDSGGSPLAAPGMTEIAASGTYALSLDRFGVHGTGGGELEVHRAGRGGIALGLGAGAILELGRGTRAGLSVLHLGPRMAGFALPATFRAGVAWAPAAQWLGAVDVTAPITSGAARISAGGEYWIVPAFAVRAGYRLELSDQGDQGGGGATAGLGVRMGTFGLDYAVEAAGDPGWAHRVSLLWSPRPIAVAIESPKSATLEPDRAGPESVAQDTMSSGSGPAPGTEAVAPVSPVSEAAPTPAPASGPAVPVAALYATAKIKYEMKDYRGAWKDAAEIIRQEPRDARAWQLLGNCQYKLGDVPGALKSFGYSLRFNPDNPALKSWVDSLSAAK